MGCTAILADAKEVGYVSAGAKAPRSARPHYENEESLFKAMWACVRIGFAVPAA